MLASHLGSVEFLNEQRLALGKASPLVASSQTSEVAHLTKLFRSSTSDRRDATDVIKAMRADESTVFTDEQRVQLSDVVSLVSLN